MKTIRKPLAELYVLWDQLRNVPTQELDHGTVIDEEFQHLPRGTAVEDVWRWFETQNPRFVVGEVMEGIRMKETDQIIHLTETGANAGRRFCTADRADGHRNVHGAYAPLENPTFRVQVCLDCLSVWANEAYELGDAIPNYLAVLRVKNRGGQKQTVAEVDPRQLALVLP
jgi:hypothetical protein